MNSLNELTTTTNTGRLTVAGTTTSPATNVTVNTSNAVLYADTAFASTNQPWVNGNNTFTAIAKDAYGRQDTNSITVLQATNVYSYDLNGNLLFDGRRAFDYDDENELIRVTVTNAWKSEFTYDGKMRRRILKEFSWNGSSWTQTNEVHFVYDGNLVVQERDANNLPVVTYTRGNDLSGTMQGAGGIGGLLARTENAAILNSSSSPFASALYHCDGNGNVTCLIYTNQLIAARYLYDPYGNMLSKSGSLADANTYRFSSKEWNENSGLYYYLYRLYDGNAQRWLNRDPSGEKRGFNLYEFGKNEPTIAIDPNGHFSLVEITVGIIVISGVVGVLNAWHQHCKCAAAIDEWRAALQSCRDEYDALGENPTYDQLINFMDKYKAGSISGAINNCAKQKNPDAVNKMTKECGESSAGGMVDGSLPVP